MNKKSNNNYYVYYCKSDKKTGKPIIIKDGSNSYNVKSVKLKDVNTKLEFNNSPSSIRSRGATTVLIFDKSKFSIRLWGDKGFITKRL